MKYNVKDFTLEEKLALLVGKNHWQTDSANGKLPELLLCDGPHGVRKCINGKAESATAMPNLSALANSWDETLAFACGETIADECVEMDVDILLAPGVNIKRTPLCGRNFEYFSEDPLLAGYMGKAYIEGVQSKGVGTSLKHFALNNREYHRLVQSSEVDERTFREIYAPAFEIALQAKPTTVMCSYNLVNGVYASENEKLLRKTLREEFGFEGVIVSDWSAVRNSAKAAKASLDLRMPCFVNAVSELKNALEEGWLTEEEVDKRVEKILELVEKREKADKKRTVSFTKDERHERAVGSARECIVLLKNTDNILPIQGGSVVVADAPHPVPPADTPFAFPPMGGGGSAYVATDFSPRPLHTELAQRLQDKPVTVSEASHRWCPSVESVGYKADTVVLAVGTNKTVESENFDRATLRLHPAQEEMILNVAKVNPNVVVVVYAGSAIDMRAWADKVKGIVFAGYLGEGASEAVADVLSGKYAPCGKLSETFPLCLEDTPTGSSCGNGYVERYDEGVFVGYRWYDSKKKDVLFPFGHGLSYAEFEYSDLKIEKKGETDYEVSFTVKNVSNVDGKEISQLYIRDPFSSVVRPEKELKGFTKTALKAGESKRITLALNARSFAFYSTSFDTWYVENGEFEILVGASSRDIRLSETIEIDLPMPTQAARAFKY